jgi:hypothetical protein
MKDQQVETPINRVSDGVFAIKASNRACATIVPYRVEMVSCRALRQNKRNIIGFVRGPRVICRDYVNALPDARPK